MSTGLKSAAMATDRKRVEASDGDWSAHCVAIDGQVTLEIEQTTGDGVVRVTVPLSVRRAHALRRILGAVLDEADQPRGDVISLGPQIGSRIETIWASRDENIWNAVLDDYRQRADERNEGLLARSVERLELDKLRSMTPRAWYDFLHDAYFPWKHLARSRYLTSILRLEALAEAGRLDELDQVRKKLLQQPSDVAAALRIADSIPGLGPAGASGLLALLYPNTFAAIDQFVLKALRQIPGLHYVGRIPPHAPTIEDVASLIGIIQDKALENSRHFGRPWTPRMVDMVLWASG